MINNSILCHIHEVQLWNEMLKRKHDLADTCLYCNEHMEIFAHIYFKCINVKRLRKDTTRVKNIYDRHLRISYHEKIFGC